MQQLIDKVEHYLYSVEGIAEVIVAYSGGVDSHVLLHVCSQLQPRLKTLSFKAIHIDHGLQQDASKWATHCLRVATSLGLECRVERVNANDVNGDGPEQAARNARYAALRAHCSKQTLVLTAQHQEDQAETLMLQLFRGAGVKGLASMPRLTAFGDGLIGRPLLECSQQEILDYAQQQQLDWVEDPSNLALAYDRNFIRQQLIPLIKQRWPAFAKTTARTASHCAEASAVLEDYAASLLMPQRRAEFDLVSIADQDDRHRRLMLRQWLADNAVRMPSEKVLQQLLMLLTAKKSACVAWAQYQVHLYKGFLHLNQQQLEPVPLTGIVWQAETIELPGSSGELSKRSVLRGGISSRYWSESRVSIRRRVGGESLQVMGRSCRKTLKKLYNESHVFPWLRDHLPLIYVDDELVAVADLWLAEGFSAMEGEEMYCIEWSHPGFCIQ